jgi:hypothetical protein
MPDMPIRLEAETIINDCNAQNKEELLSRSMTVTSSVVDTAYRDGFYRDGRNNIPISERARRVYVPDMPPFLGEADRHPNLMTEEYLEERNRPRSQGSVLGDRSAQVRKANKRRLDAAREAKNSSSLSNPPSRAGNQESFDDAFSDYYQGLLPLNGVGEVEPESQFQLFLVQKQKEDKRANTAPTTLGRRGGGGEREGRGDDLADDSMAFEDSSLRYGASYASSLSRDEHGSLPPQSSQCDDSLIVDWNQDPGLQSRPPSRQKSTDNNTGQIVQSVDMFFP